MLLSIAKSVRFMSVTRKMIHGLLLARSSYSDAEDLLQDVFVKALARIGSLRDASSVGPWLASIARRAAVDHHRGARLNLMVDEKIETAQPTRRPATEAARAALESIQQLPDAYRETLMLPLVEGMTGPEIAARTGMTHESVRVNLCRGMKLLRVALETKNHA